jgi:D-alanine transaminase
MGTYIWNGKEISESSRAIVDVEDRGFNFGDGIYEVFRVYNGKLFEPKLHWERLMRSAAGIRITLPYTVEEFAAGIEKLMEADQLKEGIVYLQVTRGAAPRAHGFPQPPVRPTVVAFTKEVVRPETAMREGISVITHPDIRWLRCDIKSLNLLPNVLAKQAASDAGAAEAILHRDGVVTEGNSSNIAIVKDGLLFTHPADNLILHGVTRAVALRLAAALGIPLREEAFSVEGLYEADEAILLGTTIEVMPIVSVDGKAIGDGTPGPVTRRLQEEFEKYAQIAQP